MNAQPFVGEIGGDWLAGLGGSGVVRDVAVLGEAGKKTSRGRCGAFRLGFGQEGD